MAAFADTALEVFRHAIGHQKLSIFRPAVEFLYQSDLFHSQGLAMRCAGILLVRRTIADVTIHHDQSRTVAGFKKFVIGIR